MDSLTSSSAFVVPTLAGIRSTRTAKLPGRQCSAHAQQIDVQDEQVRCGRLESGIRPRVTNEGTGLTPGALQFLSCAGRSGRRMLSAMP
jgi:hypothetical protein